MRFDTLDPQQNKPKQFYVIIGLSVACVLLGVWAIISNSRASKAKDLLEQAESAEPTIVELESEHGEAELTIAQIAETLEIASDLVTTKYRYTDVDIYEKTATIFNFSTPFKDKTVYTYNGEIMAGIDLSAVKIDVDNKREVITLELPKAKKIAHEIDHKSFQFYDVKNSAFVSTSLDEYSELMDVMQTQKEAELRANGFFDDVQKDAKKVLLDILRANEATKDYEIKFEDAD